MRLTRFFRRRLLALRPPGPQAQVIGLCRFSYPATGGFQAGPQTLAERAAYLYDPDRLDERFRLFEALTLPSIRAQSDPDFTLLIVIGTDLPPARQAQLRDLTADVPQVVIQAHPQGEHRPVLKAAINSVRRPGCFSIQFRNDDDDAIGVGFVAGLRQTLRESLPLFRAHRHVAVDFTRGWNVLASDRGIQAEPVQRLFLGVAFGIVFRPDVALSVMNFTHHEVWKHMPTLSRTEPDMFLRGGNDHNDSGTRHSPALPLLTVEQEAHFQRAFGVSAARVRAIYGR